MPCEAFLAGIADERSRDRMRGRTAGTDGPVGPLRNGPEVPSLRGVDSRGVVGRPTLPAVVVPTSVLLDGLTALAAAGTRLDVAHAALPPLLALPGVRAGAVVARTGAEVVVQGSAGYECGTMAPGQRLPLDSGLPVTEAVRTDRTVVRGAGPSWVAAPFRRRGAGALVVSLNAPPPDDVAPVEVLARAVGAALERTHETERALADLAGLSAGSVARPDVDPALDPALAVAARTLPRDGVAGGDVLLALPDGRTGSWLVVADVCGSGPAAAGLARSVATAVRALAPHCTGPAGLLGELERSLRPAVGPGSFVTAVVVHLQGRSARIASAGHPAPLLLDPSGASALEVPAGPPLALETGGDDVPRQVAVELPAGALLLLHTDGLVDRDGARCTDPLTLLPGAPADPQTVLEQVLAAAEGAGAASDDAAVMVARVPRA